MCAQKAQLHQRESRCVHSRLSFINLSHELKTIISFACNGHIINNERSLLQYDRDKNYLPIPKASCRSTECPFYLIPGHDAVTGVSMHGKVAFAGDL
jgi:hypothetical protein